MDFLIKIGWVLISLSYFLGQFAHFVLKAAVVILSPSPINSMAEYWHKYWPKLVNRFLWATCIFVAVAVLPKLFFPSYDLDVKLSQLTPLSALLFKCAVCCMVGLSTDSLLDKAQGMISSKTGMDLSDSIASSPTGKTVIGTMPDK